MFEDLRHLLYYIVTINRLSLSLNCFPGAKKSAYRLILSVATSAALIFRLSRSRTAREELQGSSVLRARQIKRHFSSFAGSIFYLVGYP